MSEENKEEAPKEELTEQDKEVPKEEKKELVLNNVQQYFSEDGMAERTTNRSIRVLAKIGKILSEENIQFTFGRTFKTENQMGDATHPPMLFFAGEKVEVNFVVPPMDKYGNTGKSYLTPQQLKTLQDAVTLDGNEKLIIPEEELKKQYEDQEPIENESNTKS